MHDSSSVLLLDIYESAFIITNYDFVVLMLYCAKIWVCVCVISIIVVVFDWAQGSQKTVWMQTWVLKRGPIASEGDRSLWIDVVGIIRIIMRMRKHIRDHQIIISIKLWFKSLQNYINGDNLWFYRTSLSLRFSFHLPCITLCLYI